ncbi:MAG: type 2 isopentenyl-diphosphate Delta-isomerase [Bacteroidetes bacterium]|nr:type 2 isopentenyl-diphosphate Delta-isomerase [Bacteroidota bacterium]MCH8523615.1 type 2 isopentenyl-diphosphate Delta-isomerase [Balneolales bacterium]
MSIQNRKADHIRLTVDNQSAYTFNAGFERYRFRHNALPELNLSDISTEAKLLGTTFSMPLFISSMTGGFAGASQVNEIIASVCESQNIPFGVGSQRAILEKPETIESFSIVRKKAPNAFIAGNIGGAQLAGNLPVESINILIDSIRADAIIVHLNPLQELMQPEGDRNFKGILDGIANLASCTQVPVIVKETGAGISAKVALLLLQAGAKVIDIAGSGGTSWAKVENLRTDEKYLRVFNDWGITTVDCLTDLRNAGINHENIIASGGIRSAHDVIKSICLGAGFAATAQPVIQAVMHGGSNALTELVEQWRTIMRYTLLLTGCSDIKDLNEEILYK